MKRLFLIFGAIFIFLFDISAQNEHNLSKNYKIVIDPGHGGSDPGALGSFSRESDVALDISKKVGVLVNDYYGDNVELLFTRTEDVHVSLVQRSNIANNNDADLFISIHCNAATNKSAHGYESWVMGLHVSDAALALAKKENAVILMEDDYEDVYQNFDPNSTDAYIIFSLYQSIYIDNSLILASAVQKQFNNTFYTPNRGVKQAGFLVLWRVTMPSVLIETGFISNVAEEKILNSEEGKNNYAQGICNAIVEYISYIDANENASHIENNKIQNTVDINKIQNTVDTNMVNDLVIYSVQVASSDVSLGVNSSSFKQYTAIEYIHNGLYKYSIGEFSSKQEALEYQKKLREEGFEGCFVIKLQGGKRI